MLLLACTIIAPVWLVFVPLESMVVYYVVFPSYFSTWKSNPMTDLYWWSPIFQLTSLSFKWNIKTFSYYQHEYYCLLLCFFIMFSCLYVDCWIISNHERSVSGNWSGAGLKSNERERSGERALQKVVERERGVAERERSGERAISGAHGPLKPQTHLPTDAKLPSWVLTKNRESKMDSTTFQFSKDRIKF